MKVESTKLKEVKIIEYEQKYDNRGFSYSIYSKKVLLLSGINFEYVEERVYFLKKLARFTEYIFKIIRKRRRNFYIA